MPILFCVPSSGVDLKLLAITWTIGFMIAPALAVFEGATGAKIVSQKAIE